MQRIWLTLLALIMPALIIGVADAAGKSASTELHLNAESLNLIRQELGFNLWVQKTRDLYWDSSAVKRPVRVAVLDKGFRDWQARVGITLPVATKFVPGPLSSSNLTPHGTLMAEILTSLVAGDAASLPSLRHLPMELYLIQVAGFTNFRSAMDTILKEKIDLVLYSEVWELGGNGDGKGFINKEVTRVTDAGVLWINAAGNFSSRTYNSPIKVRADRFVELPYDHNALEVVCDPAAGEKECLIKATLTWNLFQDDWQQGTTKDLDLGLFDANGKKIQVSNLKQVDHPGDAVGDESKYPRESLAASIPKGHYYLRVRADSKEWGDNDRLRILVDGDFLSLPEFSQDESLQNPADHPAVIAVGGSDALRSSISKSLHKPELVVRSSLGERFGKEFRGSSNAAAIVAAGAVLMKYLDPQMNRQVFLQSVSGGIGGQSAMTWEDLGMPSPRSCVNDLRDQVSPGANPLILALLKKGGHWLETLRGSTLILDGEVADFLPELMAPNYQADRQAAFVTPEGLRLVPRGQGMPPGSVEILQRPQGTQFCGEDRAPREFNLRQIGTGME